MIIDVALLVDNGSSCLLHELERACQVIFGEHCAVKAKTHILKLGRVFCDNRPYSMGYLSREYMKKNGSIMAEARYSLFYMATSPYDSG